MSKEEPKVLTRMRLSCCWGDNLNEKELNEVVDYITYLQRENKQLKEKIDKAIEILQDSSSYDDDDFESMRFQNDLLKILKGGVDNE